MALGSSCAISLLVGLGNPGVSYDATRHNIGFVALDAFVAEYLGQWRYEKKFNGLVAEVMVNEEKVFCLKPQTFMNLSGDSVGRFCAYRGILPQKVMVVCDDVTIPMGHFKVSAIAGNAGHNGIKSIAKSLGDGFIRYRIGVGIKPKYIPLDGFVLGRFTAEELKQLDPVIKTFKHNIEVFIDKGVEKGLNFIER